MPKLNRKLAISKTRKRRETTVSSSCYLFSIKEDSPEREREALFYISLMSVAASNRPGDAAESIKFYLTKFNSF
jgi:hypothetical protein